MRKRSTPMDLTAELVALVERIEPDPGPEPGTTNPSAEQYDTIVASLLSEHIPEDLWVFAYGSLNLESGIRVR